MLGDLVHVTADVWAEMKKACSYKVDVSVTEDGVIHECQCECASGQGPAAHCKHVDTVLYALVLFCEDGELLTELTCTQVSQKYMK